MPRTMASLLTIRNECIAKKRQRSVTVGNWCYIVNAQQRKSSGSSQCASCLYFYKILIVLFQLILLLLLLFYDLDIPMAFLPHRTIRLGTHMSAQYISTRWVLNGTRIQGVGSKPITYANEPATHVAMFQLWLHIRNFH